MTESVNSWPKPAAMAIPDSGYLELTRGRYGPVYPRTPACYGFNIIAKVLDGHEQAIRDYGKQLEYTEDAVKLFSSTGIRTAFTHLEGFPEDWKTNPEAFIMFVREHQVPSFLEYGEYPYVTSEEIKKALGLKAAFNGMLDQMQ